jgi:hypothetical protein
MRCQQFFFLYWKFSLFYPSALIYTLNALTVTYFKGILFSGWEWDGNIKQDGRKRF